MGWEKTESILRRRTKIIEMTRRILTKVTTVHGLLVSSLQGNGDRTTIFGNH